MDGIERGLELEWIESSLFYHQLKLRGIKNSFKELFELLNDLWDKRGIPYNKGYDLLLVENELLGSLFVWYSTIYYMEQGLWVRMIQVKANTINFSKTRMLQLDIRNGLIYWEKKCMDGFGKFTQMVFLLHH